MSLERSSEQVFFVCGLKQDEDVAIVTDEKTLDIGKALKKEAGKKTGNVSLFILEKYGKRPLQSVPKEIEDAIKSADLSIIAVQKIGNEINTIRKPLRSLGVLHGRCVTMPGVNKKVFETGMVTDQRKVLEFSARVCKFLKKAKKMQIKTVKGTNLSLTFSKKYKWVDSPGDLTKKKNPGTNLPGSEVFTFPKDISGTTIIDGELGDWFTEKYRLLDYPLVLEIKKGKVVSVSSENKELEKDFSEYIRTDENSDRIGEVAIGTNIFLKELIGVFLQDEKFPSFHLAVGNPYPEITGAPYSSRVHCDGIILEPDVWACGKKIMERGKFIQAAFQK